MVLLQFSPLLPPSPSPPRGMLRLEVDEAEDKVEAEDEVVAEATPVEAAEEDEGDHRRYRKMAF